MLPMSAKVRIGSFPTQGSDAGRLPINRRSTWGSWKQLVALLFAFSYVLRLDAQNLVLVPTISTIAGNGQVGNAGVGGPAKSAELHNPLNDVVDAAGNIYFTDFYNNRVLRIDGSTGILTLVAGTGTAGFSGDNGPATKAELYGPSGLALDASGNLYVGDAHNSRVRKLNLSTGIITTYAGNGTAGFSGDGGPATNAAFSYPDGLAFDAAGNLYIADAINFRIRKVTASTGIVTTIAGTGVQGFSGDGGQATNAEINQQYSVAIDVNGNIYFADGDNQRIRKVTTAGIISTIGGNGVAGFTGDGGLATAAEIHLGTGSSLDVDRAGDVVFTDEVNCRIREIFASSGTIQTIAGNGTCGYSGDGGSALSAELNGPQRVQYSPQSGIFIIADTANNVERRLTATTQPFPPTTVGSSSTTQTIYLQTTAAIKINSISVPKSQDGKQEFTVGSITGCTVNGTTLNPSGTVCAISITFTPGFPGQRDLPLIASTSTGTVSFELSGFGLGPQVTLLSGTISTVAGTGTAGYAGDGGAASAASLNSPRAITLDPQGNTYFADYTNNVVRKLTAASGVVSTVAGNGAACGTSTAACGDGGAATSANLNGPSGVALDTVGNLYIADRNDNRVRRVDSATGVITTYVGSGTAGFTGDGGVSGAAKLNAVTGIAFDQHNGLYIADSGNNVIRMVDGSNGIITTIAGNGTACSATTATCGDGGLATSANLSRPNGVGVDSSLNIYIADTNNNRVRMVNSLTGVISTIAGTGTAAYGGDGGAATSATLSGPRMLALDNAENIYIADSVNNVVRLVSSATGVINTVAGISATPCATSTAACGDGGRATLANLNAPRAVALDLDNNLYIADTGDNRIREVGDLTAAFSFASTPLGSTSTDSPQTLTLLSSGTTALDFPIPGSGTNPSISNSFTIGSSSSCPQLTSSSSSQGQLALGATCNYLLSFNPDTVGAIHGSLIVKDDGETPSSPGMQTVSLTGIGTQAVATQNLSSSNLSPQFGQSVTLTDTFTAVAGIFPTGTVTFYSGSTSLGTGTINSSGVAILATTQLPIGTDTVTASYPGDSNFASGTSNSVTETVGKAASSNTLTSSNLTPNVGQAVTLTDTVSQVDGVVPTGTVTFYNGSVSLGTGTLNSAGVATLTTSSLPVGTMTITATYGGNTTYGSSTSNAVTETVSKNAGSNTLMTSNAAPSFGQSVTLTDTLATVNGIVPTGTVTFFSGSTSIGTGSVNSSGVANLTTSTLPLGTDSITASYGGDSSNNTSQSNTVTETVGKATDSGTLTTSNATPAFGQSVTLTDTLTSVNGVIPTGTVTFYNGTTALGTGSVNASGVATLTTSALPVGTDSITATYGGNTTYNSATAAAITETVTKGTDASTLTSSNTTPTYGQSVTLLDTLTSINGVIPTGTVTFYNGTTAIGTGTVNSSGVATLTTGSLPAGMDSITASYGGDNNYSSNTSNAVTETVTKATGTNVLSTSNATPAFGQSVTLTDTLSAANGVVPTGTVTFYNGSTVLGTGTVNSSGVATLATTSLPVGTDSVTATYGGDDNFNTKTSNAVSETVGKGTATGTLSTSNAAPSYGESVTLTDTLTAINGVIPTGTVTFYSGSTAIGTGTVDSTGVATLTTRALPVGTDPVTATYGGDSNYVSSTSNVVTETVSKRTDTATLTTSNATPNYGQAVTLTNTLSSANGTFPTGTVTFYNGTTSLGTGTVNSSGVATLSTSALPTGTDSVTAVYGGDTNFNTNTSNVVTETVAKATSTDTLTTSNATPNYGQPVTLTATLTSVNGVVPTGTVTFYNGTTSLGTGTVNSSGVATLTTSALPIGTDSVTAVYGGDTSYASSTSAAVTETVGKAAGGATLTTSNATPNYGQSVTLTDTLTTANGVVPTGTVTFYNGTTSLGTGTVNASGVATLVTMALPVGTDSVTAVYGGDTNYSATTSNAVTETVAKDAPAGTLTTSNASPTYGQSVTLTDTLPTVNGVAPTGTVTFYNGTTSLGTGTVNSSGVAILATGSLPVGTDSVTAVYGGDSNYSSNTSNAVAETVTKSAATGTLTTSNATPTYGQSVTLTDTLPTVNGVAPTGTVTFYNGSAILGTGTVNSAGIATLTTGSLPVGTDSITAVYGGDNNYSSTTAGPLTETVSKNTGTNTLTSSNTAPYSGQSVTLTDTLATVNGLAPTGSVTFYNGSTSLGTGTVNSSGVATLTTSTLPLGSDPVTAVYGGDSNYASSTSNVVTENVTRNTSTGSLTTSNSAPSFGQPVTLTDTLPTQNGIVPTGTVTFYNGNTSLGTGTVNASGVATLTTGALPVGTDSVTAVYGGDGNYSSVTSNAVAEKVSKNIGTGTLTTSNATPDAGQSVTLTDTLPSVNGVQPTGTVTFYSGTTSLGTGTVNSSGVATLATTALPVGTDSVTAVYGGDGNYASTTSNAVSETVTKNTDNATLTASSTSAAFGQPITLTDTLPTLNGIVPTGTVTFYNGSTAIGTGTLNSSGVATLTTGSLPVGADSITAVYGGDNNYGTNTSNPVTVTVSKNAGSDTLSTSNASPSYSQTVTLTDTLSSSNGVVPTGTVTFYNGSASLGTGTVNSAGVATLTTGALPVGTDSVTAVYGGDSNYSSSTSNAVTETVAKASETGTLTTSNASPTLGQSVTLTDTLATVNGTAPTGTVTFYSGTTSLGTGTVNSSGIATLATSALPVGTDTVTAVYGGDSNYSTGTSNAVTETVSKGNGSDALTASTTAPSYGQSITLTDTLPIVNGVTPTGTVTFYNGTAVIGTGTVNSSGVATLSTATLTTTSLPVGTNSITAVYGGDGNYSSATSNPLVITVTKGAGGGTLTTSNSTLNYGEAVTLTDTLTAANGVFPTGTVTFYNGTTSLGTGTVNASGVARLNTSSLPVGTDAVTAVYAGDANYSTNTSNAVTETVTKSGGDGTLTTSNSTPNAGQPITLTDTLPTVNGAVPTGSVAFYNGSTAIGTGTLNSSGVATLTTGSLPVGSDTITAVYGGDSNYTTSTSNPLTETVSKNNTTGTISSSSTTPVAGQSVTLTITQPSVYGVVPTGTENFYSNGTLIGTATLNSNGVATLTLSDLPSGTDQITGLYSGDNNYQSTAPTPLTVTVGKATVNDVLTSSNVAPAAGQPVTLTDTLSTVNGVAPTGTVTFYNGSAALGTGTINASGVASLTTSSLPVGTDTVTSSYGGDNNYTATGSNAVTETVSKASAGGTLTSSNTAPNFGQSVTLTDTLPSTNGLTPTGTVTFYNGATVIGTGTVNASGVATLTTGVLPAGTDSVSAAYGGDGNFSSSTSNIVVETVGKTTPTAVLTTSNTSPTVGQMVTFTDTLSVVNAAAPTGTVTFYNGTTVIGTGTVNSSGVATLSTTSLPVGADTVTAVYAGDAAYNTATSNAVTENVTKATGTDTLSTSNPAPSFGQSVTFTDTLPIVNTVVPTGTVTFYNGTSAIGTGTVNSSGTATLTTGSLPVGTSTITAVYGGDTNFSTATSNPVTESVSKSASTDALTSTATSSVAGQPVTFTDTLPTVNGIVPTGTVTFYNGTTAIGTGAVNGSGIATLTTGALPVGTDTVTAVYSGDSDYSSTTSNMIAVTVSKDSGVGVLTTSNATPSAGQSVTLTDTLPVANGVIPTGAVIFYSGSTALGTGKINSSGVAILATTALPVGVDTITAVYGGDGNYGNGTSNAVTETVTKGSATGVLTTSNAAPLVGQSVTLTDTLLTLSGVVPTGTVIFYNGTIPLGTGTVNSSGIATLATTALPVGVATVTAVYSGDSNYGTSTSNAVAETVAKDSGTDVLTTSNATPNLGQSVTLTDTLPTVNGVVPTGTVTFYSGTTALGTGTVNSSGVATLATTALPLGVSTATAAYGGDSNYKSSTSNTVAETVTQDAAAVVLSASAISTMSGQSVTFTATVTSVNGRAPTGIVTFYSGANAVGTGTVNATGVAILATTTLPVGADAVNAVYGGDMNYGIGTSNIVTVTVTAPQPTINLTSSPNPQLFGQPVTLTATLGGTTLTMLSGAVSFYDGGTLLGAANVTSGGTAVFTTSTLLTGVRQITAVYTSADKTVTATSNTVAETIIDFTIASSTPTISVNPGNAAAFTINLGPVTGITFNAPVTLSVTGLPGNYTVKFTPASVTPEGGIVTSQMQVQTSANPLTVAAVQGHRGETALASLALGLLLTPLLGIGRIRRRLPSLLPLVIVSLIGFGVTGCGGGYLGSTPGTYTLTVTGTSSTLHHSTTVTLNVR